MSQLNRYMAITILLLWPLVSCRQKSSNESKFADFETHCQNVATIASSLAEELRGPRRERAKELTRSLTFTSCVPPGAPDPGMCMTAQDPECMNRALNTILDTLKNGSKLSAAEKRDAMETHCRRAGILARDTTKLNDLGEMGHIKGAAFAAYDYESCGAGDNRAHRECYFAGDVACIRDAAAPLDRKLFPAQR